VDGQAVDCVIRQEKESQLEYLDIQIKGRSKGCKRENARRFARMNSESSARRGAAALTASLTFYDGVDCIGGNKILLEDGGTCLFLDFGTNFGAEGKFFDEFLVPRTTFGLSDLLTLGLIPPLRGLYRPDLEYKGIWEKYSGHPLHRPIEVQGILLSHAHYDHNGYLSYIRKDIPVFASMTTA